MIEDEIASKLRANVPQEVEAPRVVIPTPTGVQDHSSVDTGIDDLTNFKLHELLGEEYRSSSSETKQQMNYIYEQISKGLESPDYINVAKQIRELLQVAGLAHTDNKVYKLYQWLRLKSVASNAFTEMDLLRG